ncbi:MAG: hypothetical protein H8E87_03355 [FCB group bacterium]|nr:hypothetical protein [FCB group bacterium]
MGIIEPFEFAYFTPPLDDSLWVCHYLAGEPVPVTPGPIQPYHSSKITFNILYSDDAAAVIDEYSFTLTSTYYLIDQQGKKVIRFDNVNASNFDAVFDNILQLIDGLIGQ